MHKFVFIVNFVINFSLYQAGVSLANNGFTENGLPHPINNDYTAVRPPKGSQDRNAGHSGFTKFYDEGNQGNGPNIHSIDILDEKSPRIPSDAFPNKVVDSENIPNNNNIGMSRNQLPSNHYIGYSNPNSQSTTNLGNQFGSNVPHGADSSYPKSTTRTDKGAYTRILDGHNDIIHIGYGHNKNNVFNVDERSHDYPPNLNPKANTNVGRGLNNGNIGLRENQPPTNYHGRNSNPQGGSSLGNRFASDVPHSVDNFYPKPTPRTEQSLYTHYSDGQNDIINIGNGRNKNNVFFINEETHGYAPGPNSGSIDSNGRRPTTNYYGRNPKPRGEPSLGDRFGSDVPLNIHPWTDTSQNRRDKNYITSIGNGVGNRNTFVINDNGNREEPTATVLPPNYENRRRTETQRNNYDPRTNSWATNTRINYNRGGNNNPIDVNTYTSIGRGSGNRNTAIINGKPIRFDSGFTVTTKDHQVRGNAIPCQLSGTCRLPAWGVPDLKRKLASNRYWFAHQPSRWSPPGFALLRKLYSKLNRFYKY